MVTAVKQIAAVRTLASLYFRPNQETMRPPSTSPDNCATSSMGASTAPICASSMPYVRTRNGTRQKPMPWLSVALRASAMNSG